MKGSADRAGSADKVESAEKAAAAERDDVVKAARDDALYLLSFRARSVTEMRGRLGRKGHGPSAIDEIVVWLVERGYLDDREFARQFVAERLRRKPRGPFALVQELRKRGIERDVAEETVTVVMEEEGVDEVEVARDAARRWLARRGEAADRETAERDRRRLHAYLTRRGFQRATIRGVLEEVEDHSQHE